MVLNALCLYLVDFQRLGDLLAFFFRVFFFGGLDIARSHDVYSFGSFCILLHGSALLADCQLWA